jgi:hypothetical protein
MPLIMVRHKSIQVIGAGKSQSCGIIVRNMMNDVWKIMCNTEPDEKFQQHMQISKQLGMSH